MCLTIGAAAIREASSPAALVRLGSVQKAKPLPLKDEASKKNGTQKARSHSSGKVMLLENTESVARNLLFCFEYSVRMDCQILWHAFRVIYFLFEDAYGLV
jgi:hypothetical protein